MPAKRNARAVELVQAFLWTCDDCGRDNFERGITVSPESIRPEDLPGADAESIQDWIESGGSGDFVTTPDHVQCKHCGAEFETATGE